MKVAATKVFTKEIQKNMKSGLFPFLDSVQYAELSPERYSFFVDSPYDNMADFLPEKGKLRAISIEYKPELYAAGRYLSTKDLNRIFRYSDGTYKGFFKTLEREIEA